MLYQKLQIAASLYNSPCNLDELLMRDFLEFTSPRLTQSLIIELEDDAIFYRGDNMHIYKDWARDNISELVETN